MDTLVGLVVAGDFEQRFVELYNGRGTIGSGPHHRYALFPKQCDFQINKNGILEPVVGSERDLEVMELGTLFSFTKARGRIASRKWFGRCASIQLGDDVKILGKVNLTNDRIAITQEVNALVSKHGIEKIGDSLDRKFWKQADEEYKEKYPEERRAA